MRLKAETAQRLGLPVYEGLLPQMTEKFDFASLINVFSHIPDFRKFVEEIKRVLNEKGQLIIETGNIADLSHYQQVPGELDLPDHLVFAGEKHLRGYLEDAGFEIISIKKVRIDGMLRVLKNIAKRIRGRKHVTVGDPYTSAYRSLIIRARLR